MKKTIFLVLCLTLSCFALTGCSDNDEPFESKSYTPSVQVAGIQLNVQDRKIDVKASDDEQVHIEYAESGKEYYDISISDEHVLTMNSANNKAWTDYIGGKPLSKDRQITVLVPSGMLESIVLSTTNADITLAALAVNEHITLSANNGNITFAGVEVGSGLYLTVKNGNITGAILGCYEDFAIRSTGKKGKSNLPECKEDGTKALQVSSNHGDVNIAFTPED